MPVVRSGRAGRISESLVKMTESLVSPKTKLTSIMKKKQTDRQRRER